MVNAKYPSELIDYFRILLQNTSLRSLLATWARGPRQNYILWNFSRIWGGQNRSPLYIFFSEVYLFISLIELYGILMNTFVWCTSSTHSKNSAKLPKPIGWACFQFFNPTVNGSLNYLNDGRLPFGFKQLVFPPLILTILALNSNS